MPLMPAHWRLTPHRRPTSHLRPKGLRLPNPRRCGWDAVKSALCVSVRLWPVLAVLAVQLALAPAIHAQAQAQFIPSVSLFTVFDDNIFARADGSAGQMTQLRPSFEGSWESPVVRLLGLYSFDMQRSNFSPLTTLDARRHGLA